MPSPLSLNLVEAPRPAIDPVCGMTVNPETAAASHEHNGTTYYFCCPSCRQKFQADPDKYLHPSGHKELAPMAGGHYTCPMHPEVMQDHPGACPLCGMALEPSMPGLEEGPNQELVDMSRRFWVGLAFTIPILLLAMGDMLPGQPLRFLNRQLANWIQLRWRFPSSSGAAGLSGSGRGHRSVSAAPTCLP